MKKNNLFPIFLKLNQIQTLIVGGGNVGLEKLQALLKNDAEAKIKIIAPYCLPEIQQIVITKEQVIWIEKPIEKEDLQGVDLMILATDNPRLHQQVTQWAKSQNLLTNVADTPILCDFYLGSTVTKGDLKFGISTNGKSPTFAKRVKEWLERIIPEKETDKLLNNLHAHRNLLKGSFSKKVKTMNDLTKDLFSDDHSEENIS